MKKVLAVFVFFLAMAATAANAQAPAAKAKEATQAPNVLPIEDIPGTAAAITSLLRPKLALSDAQAPKVTGMVSEFLKSKAGIIKLAESNPVEYAGKFAPIHSKLVSSLKAIFTTAQYNKFLSLKPKSSTSENLLSHLFF